MIISFADDFKADTKSSQEFHDHDLQLFGFSVYLLNPLLLQWNIDIVCRDALLGHVQKGMDRHYMSPDFEEDLLRSMANWISWLKGEIENRKDSKKEIVDQTVDQ